PSGLMTTTPISVEPIHEGGPLRLRATGIERTVPASRSAIHSTNPSACRSPRTTASSVAKGDIDIRNGSSDEWGGTFNAVHVGDPADPLDLKRAPVAVAATTRPCPAVTATTGSGGLP